MPSRKAKHQATLIPREPSCHFFLFLRQTMLSVIG